MYHLPINYHQTNPGLYPAKKFPKIYPFQTVVTMQHSKIIIIVSILNCLFVCLFGKFDCQIGVIVTVQTNKIVG